MNQEQIAHNALRAYPIVPSKITFLRHNENMTFHVFDQQANTAYLLRIHSPLTPAFQSERLRPEGIISELCWLEALADETNLVLQCPVRTKDGALATTVAGEHGEITCSLLHWIEADPFPTSPLPEQVAQLGAIIATLHAHAHQWTVPETFARPVYDLAFYLQQINTLVEGVHNGIIREEDFAIIQETLEKILSILTTAQQPLMLIHADLHPGNLLASRTGIHPIDFSLCGFGFSLFDLGTCLPSIPVHLRSILLDAYQQQETFFPGYPCLIDAFFLLSRMGAYVYLLANSDEHEWLKERVPRFTAQECRAFIEGKNLLFGGIV